MNPENLIKYAVERVNEQLPNKKKIVFKKNLHIFGPKSKLDSLSIVNLFVEIENQYKKKKTKSKLIYLMTNYLVIVIVNTLSKI